MSNNTVREKSFGEIVNNPSWPKISELERQPEPLSKSFNPPEINITSPNISKSVEESKKIIQSFQDKISNYPKRLSYEGSTILCVLLSLKKENSKVYGTIHNLPEEDRNLFQEHFPQSPVPLEFYVEFDNNKDFDISFNPSSDEKARTIKFINSVANPVNSIGGQIPVEREDDQIKIGGRLKVDANLIKKMVNPNATFYTSDEKKEKDYTPQPRQQTNKNAYEIRTEVLKMAVDFSMALNSKGHLNTHTDDDVLKIAKKFYGFVENKR